MHKNKRHTSFFLLFLSIAFIWFMMAPGCKCAPGIIREINSQEQAGGGHSSIDDGGTNGDNTNGQQDGTHTGGDNGSTQPGDGSGTDGTRTGDGHATSPDHTNGTGDGHASSGDGGNGTQWPPDGLPDDTGTSCNGAPVQDVATSVCQSGKQVCVQSQYTCSPSVTLQDGRFVIDGQATFLQGVVYNPVPRCKPFNYDFTDKPDIYNRDFATLQKLGNGTVLRLTRPVSSRAFLDKAYENNLRLIVAFYVQWQQDFSQTCPQLRALWRSQLTFYRYHPAIVAYAIGEQTALHIANSNLANKTTRIKNWYACLNQLAGEVKQIEGTAARPVATVSGAHPNEPMGKAAMGASESTLSHLDFHLYQTFIDTQVGSWLRSPDRTNLKKPLAIASYGMDACRYNPQSKQCQADLGNQANAITTLARDVRAAYDNPLATRVAGGFIASYSDDLWAGEPSGDICGQNASGFPHAYFFDGHYNLEWFGLVDIHSNPAIPSPRPAFQAVSSLWGQTQAWSTGTRNIQITSHTSGANVPMQFLVSGTFSGFQKQQGESWAQFFILVRPYQSSDHYPMIPISLCCGHGPQTWMMALHVGRKQDSGQQFELIPAYTTTRAAYETMLKTSFFITKPAGLTVLNKQSILVKRQ